MYKELSFLYRVDNFEEKRGIWHTWDGQWKPVFDDILPDSIRKDLPGLVSGVYNYGWFASCENLATLFMWLSPEDMITLQKHGFRVTMWCVDKQYMKRLNDMETIFLQKEATFAGFNDFDEEYLKLLQKVLEQSK